MKFSIDLKNKQEWYAPKVNNVNPSFVASFVISVRLSSVNSACMKRWKTRCPP